MVTRPNDPVTARTARIKPNAKGIWEIWFSEKDPGGDYKTRRISTRTQDHVAAQEALDQFLQVERKTSGGTAPTIDAMCLAWLEHVEPLGKAKTGQYVLARVRDLLGACTADQLTDTRLRDYRQRRGNVSDSSIRRELGGLRTVLRWAARKKLISSDLVPEFDLPPPGEPRVTFMDPAQEQRFWDEAMAEWDRCRGHSHRLIRDQAEHVMLFVALGLETAARRGAIYDLTWDRIDLVRGVIDYRKPGRRVTKKRRVQVPISDRLLPVLEEAKARAAQAPGAPGGRVLGDTACIRKAFRNFADRLGMAWVTPHVLRHTWASLAAMNGVPLFDIAQVLGDTIATVEANYLHLAPGHLRRAINHKATPMMMMMRAAP